MCRPPRAGGMEHWLGARRYALMTLPRSAYRAPAAGYILRTIFMNRSTASTRPSPFAWGRRQHCGARLVSASIPFARWPWTRCSRPIPAIRARRWRSRRRPTRSGSRCCATIRNVPLWPNRDRFVLSNGHASMLLYALLHLAGVRDEAGGRPAVSLDDIKRFRQLDSRCPGHPEYRPYPGSRPRPARSARLRQQRRHGDGGAGSRTVSTATRSRCSITPSMRSAATAT